MRFQSTNPDPGYPIVYLAGGPGGSGIAAARGKRFPLFMALRKVADVIVLDQRGTGASNTIPPCTVPKPSFADKPVVLTRETEMVFMRGAVKHCIAFWRDKGIDLSAYDTRENALDLTTLRKALGVDKLNLWGISYGGTLALAALKVMPEHIDRVVIASPLSMSQTVRLPARTQDFLERVAALLKSDPKLGKVYPDLIGTMTSVLDRLDKKPVHVILHSPKGKPVTLVIGQFPIQFATIRMLKNPDTLRYLPIMYSAMAAGRYRLVAGQLYKAFSRPFTLGGMGLAVRAASCLSPQREKLVEKQAKTTLLGNTLNVFTETVRGIGIPPLDRDFCKPIHSDVPVLILTGTLDGRTYPAGHAQILAGLSHGSEVVIENAGHDLFMSSPKVTKDIVAFLSHRPVKYRHIKLLIPNFITVLAICAGMTGIRLAVEGRFEPAVMMVLLAAFLDGIDGRAARLLKAQTRFGVQMDSLADIISFGVAPALVLYVFLLDQAGPFGWIAALVYAIAAGLRLA
ncbi:MAG: alpha/beta fold hydrolase, partial [Nitrosospira sp.]|nr:alpha/beta fold hydrolase [Nitrosospira sp.]